jgi:hypothetical protein
MYRGIRNCGRRLMPIIAAGLMLMSGCTSADSEVDSSIGSDIIEAVDNYNAACNKTNGLNNYTAESITRRYIDSENENYRENSELKVNIEYDYSKESPEIIERSQITNLDSGESQEMTSYFKDGIRYLDNGGDKMQHSSGFNVESELLHYSFTLKYPMVKSVTYADGEYTFELNGDECHDRIMMEYTIDDKADKLELKAKISDGRLEMVSLEADCTTTEEALAVNKGLKAGTEEYDAVKNKDRAVKTRVYRSTEYTAEGKTKPSFPELNIYRQELATETTTAEAVTEDRNEQ